MNGAVQAIINGYFLQTRLEHDRQQIKNEIGQFKKFVFILAHVASTHWIRPKTRWQY